MASLAAKCRKAERMFSKARKRAKEESGFQELPDGKYIGLLTHFEIGESKSSDRLQAMLGYTIQEGEFAKEVARTYNGLEDEDQIMYLCRDLERLGYEMPDSMDELEALGKEMLKDRVCVRFTLKTKGEFQNLFINKVLTNKDYDDDDGDDDATEVPPKRTKFPFTDDDRVSVEIDGETYKGTVKGSNDDGTEAYIHFDDGDQQYHAIDDVTLLDAGEPEPTADDGDGTLDVGDRVVAEIDGSEYSGEITEIDGTTATVKFDDGDVDDFEIDDLNAEEESADASGGDDGDDTSQFEVEKGMNVEVKVGRKNIDGEVTRVSTANETINVREEDGTLHKDVPIEKILTVYDDD